MIDVIPNFSHCSRAAPVSSSSAGEYAAEMYVKTLPMRPPKKQIDAQVARPAVLDAQFRITQIKADTKPPRLIEQRLGRIVRHAALEPGVDFRLVLHEVAREEGGQRKLGKDDELAVARRGLATTARRSFVAALSRRRCGSGPTQTPTRSGRM